MNQAQRDRQHNERLNRIIARLFSLADIVEAASRLPAPICLFMLWIARPVEALARRAMVKWARSMAQASPVARRWIAETGLACELHFLPTSSDGAASELIGLALRLRECAMALQTLSAIDEVCWFEDDLDAGWSEGLVIRRLDLALLAIDPYRALCAAQNTPRPEVRAGSVPQIA